MTVLLDAYAVIGFLGDEPCAEEVEGLLRGGAAVSSVNLAECIDRMERVHGVDVDDDIDLLEVNGLRILPVDDTIGRRAGHLRSARYHRERAPISLADCTAAATALVHDLPLATSDGPLAEVLIAEGGRVVALPDSTGTRPT